jgi:inositol phosphorylceramide mannosyltransferase catalytic subunit
MTIPKLFHRIWLDDPVPEVFAGYWDKLQDLHPEWEFRAWDSSEDVPELQNQQLFDNAQDLCPKDWKRFQADILRLELLYLYGGIYVDADVEPIRPFDMLVDFQCIVPFSPNRGKAGERLLTQYVIGAEPGHPFIKTCIDTLPKAFRKHRSQPLAQMIGPWHITRTFRSQLWDNVALLPEHTFSDKLVPKGCEQYILALHKWNNKRRKNGKGLD